MTAAPSAMCGSLSGNSTSANAPMVATLMRKFSSNTWPWPMFFAARSSTS